MQYGMLANPILVSLGSSHHDVLVLMNQVEGRNLRPQRRLLRMNAAPVEGCKLLRCACCRSFSAERHGSRANSSAASEDDVYG